MIGVHASTTYDNRWRELKIGQKIQYRKTYYGSMTDNQAGIIEDVS